MNTDNYEAEIEIGARRARVWQALTDRAELETWFCEHAEVSLAEHRFDYWGRFTPEVPDHESGRHEILACEPEELLRYRWHFLGGDTIATIALRDAGAGTVVTTRHEHVPPRAQPAMLQPRHFWSNALAQLRAWLEVGRVGPRFDWSWPHVGRLEVHADVEAPAERVWQALVEGWEGPVAAGSIDVGVIVGLKVLESTPAECFVLEWDDHAHDAPTVLTYTLSGSRGRTRITLVQSGFRPDEDVQGQAEGFFSGLYLLAFDLESNGDWPRRPATVPARGETQSGWEFGVRTLASGA